MIKFEKLIAKNFLSYGNNPLEYNFKNGITHIQGKSGHGKSVLIDALCYVFFNSAYKDIKLAKLVNWKNKYDASVTCYFSKNDKQYYVQRTQKVKGQDDFFGVYELKENGEWELIPLLPKKTNYQKQFEENILGMDKYYFEMIVVKSCSKPISFVSLPKAKRMEFMDNVFSVHLFDYIAEENKKYITEMTNSKSLLNNSLSLSEKNLDVYKQILENSNQQVKDVISNQIIDLEKEITENNDTLEKNKQGLEILKKYEDSYNLKKSEIQNAEYKKREIESELTIEKNKVESEINNQMLVVEREFDANKKTIETDISSQSESTKNELNEKIKENDRVYNSTKNKISEEYNNKNRQLNDETGKKIKELEIEQTSLNTFIKTSTEQFKIFADECGACPTLKKIKDSKNYDANAKRLDEIKVDLNNLQTMLTVEKEEALEKYNSGNKANEENYKVADKQLKELLEAEKSKWISVYNEKLSGLKEKLSIDKKLIEDSLIVKKSEVESSFLTKKQDIENSLVTMKTELNDLEQYILKINHVSMNIMRCNNIIEQNKVKINSLKIELDKKSNSDKEINQLNEIKLEIQKYTNDIIETDKIIRNEELLKKLIQPMKFYVVKKWMPYFNKLLNEYLIKFEMDKTVIFDESFKETVSYKNKVEMDYDALSTGEMRRVDISIMFALIDLSKKIKNQNYNLLILDEVVHGLDKQSLDLFLEILKEKAKDSEIIFMVHNVTFPDNSINRNYLVEKTIFSEMKEI